MADNETESLLAGIGQRLLEGLGRPPANILLYAQPDVNMVTLAIFIERDDHIEYTDAIDGLSYPLLDLWEEQEPALRWAEIEYILRDGKFTAYFTYAGQFDPHEDHFERRREIVRRHFGDKPIVYPPLLDDDGPTFEL